MSILSLARGIRATFQLLSRRNFEVRPSGHHKNKSITKAEALATADERSGWAGLPVELLQEVINSLEESENASSIWKDVVACAGVCKAWREVCKEILRSPSFRGKFIYPFSLKQPGPRDGMIQCVIKRDKQSLTYHLFLSLGSALLMQHGKFLLSAKRNQRAMCTEYIIFLNADNVSRSRGTCIGKLRSNILGTKFIIYESHHCSKIAHLSRCGLMRRKFSPRKVCPRLLGGGDSIAQVQYELNLLGARSPRRMRCRLHSRVASAGGTGQTEPDEPELLWVDSLGISRLHRPRNSNSCLASLHKHNGTGRPFLLINKPPWWHEELQCWCLNFHGRVTVASVKNFQLVSAQPSVQATTGLESDPHEPEKMILQFGKVDKDMFTMDYSYPLSAFHAFAICLSTFGSKFSCQ